MNKHILWKLSALAAVLALTLTLGLAVATGTTAAQSANVTNDSVEIGSDDEPESVEHTVGALEVLSTELRDDGVVVLEVRATEPTSYELSDAYAGSQKQGWTDVPDTSDVIRSGRHTIRLDVTVIEGSAMVTLATPEESSRWNAKPLQTGRPAIQFSTAALAVLVSGSGAGFYSYRKGREKMEDTDEPEVDRIA